MKKLVLLFFALAGPLAMAQEGFIYLQCKSDPEYNEVAQIVIDKNKQGIALHGLKDFLPLVETDTMLGGSVSREGQVMIAIEVNKYTLRYRIENAMGPAFGLSRMVFGQCAIEEKKL